MFLRTLLYGVSGQSVDQLVRNAGIIMNDE
jgi:hypothetical protein